MLEKYDIKEIRFLPMDNKVEFRDEEAVRAYLEKKLPVDNEGKYYYHQRGIDLKNVDTLVLFQYNSSLIGYGVFKTRDFEKDVNGKKIKELGYNEFYVDSIYNIEKISSEEFKMVVPTFKRFSQSMQKIDIKFLESISNLIEKKRKAFSQN